MSDAPENTQLATTVKNDDLLIDTMLNSLYPGASRESVAMVLSYCRVNGLNPMMKPVHIVRMKVTEWRQGKKVEEYRDVIMPGIGDYRIKAARSGEYGGKSEPEFGPTIQSNELGASYPEWCRITVNRIVHGEARPFVAKEYWLENYANDGHSNKPNYMWKKRPFGQLAKCAEAQALRMAFPEFSGSQPTAEEMEGKDSFSGQTIDHEPASHQRSRPNVKPIDPKVNPQASQPHGLMRQTADEIERKRDEKFIDDLALEFAAAKTEEDANAISASLTKRDKMPAWMQDRIEELEVDTIDRLRREMSGEPAGGENNE